MELPPLYSIREQQTDQITGQSSK